MPVPLYLSGVVIIFAFLDLGKNISFSNSLLRAGKSGITSSDFCLIDQLLYSFYQTGFVSVHLHHIQPEQIRFFFQEL